MNTDDEVAIWEALKSVADPEIPVISLVEMGIVREATVENGRAHIKITPTFSGCPALHVMKQDIEDRLSQAGFAPVTVEVVLHPPWSSDLISDAGREKLRDFGLAPPPKHDGDLISVAFIDLVACPRCGSSDTTLKNSFGPTLCRAIWYCNACQDPFEQFKPL